MKIVDDQTSDSQGNAEVIRIAADEGSYGRRLAESDTERGQTKGPRGYAISGRGAVARRRLRGPELPTSVVFSRASEWKSGP